MTIVSFINREDTHKFERWNTRCTLACTKKKVPHIFYPDMFTWVQKVFFADIAI